MDPHRIPQTDPEPARLALLHSYGVLDTPPEPEFDALAIAAARTLAAPAAAVTLVAEERCWFKARVGIDIPETPRQRSLCGYAFKSSGTFVVEDATKDDRFHHVPIVAEAGFNFYIGVPLLTAGGHSLGTLCVLDRVPRTPTPEQVSRLQMLAGRVLQQLEIRRAALTVPAIPLRRIVLIVDDEAPIRDLVTTAFDRYEVPTLSATNGVEALRIYHERRDEIAVVLTDLHMPEMNGLQLIRALRREPNPPVITVMSGWLDPQVRSVLATENTACVIEKPFRFADFAPVVTLARQATGAPVRPA